MAHSQHDRPMSTTSRSPIGASRTTSSTPSPTRRRPSSRRFWKLFVGPEGAPIRAASPREGSVETMGQLRLERQDSAQLAHHPGPDAARGLCRGPRAGPPAPQEPHEGVLGAARTSHAGLREAARGAAADRAETGVVRGFLSRLRKASPELARKCQNGQGAQGTRSLRAVAPRGSPGTYTATRCRCESTTGTLSGHS